MCEAKLIAFDRSSKSLIQKRIELPSTSASTEKPRYMKLIRGSSGFMTVKSTS